MKLHWKAKAQGMQFTHRYKQQDLKAKFILNCWSSWSFQYTSSYRMFNFIGWDSFSALLEALSVTMSALQTSSPGLSGLRKGDQYSLHVHLSGLHWSLCIACSPPARLTFVSPSLHMSSEVHVRHQPRAPLLGASMLSLDWVSGKVPQVLLETDSPPFPPSISSQHFLYSSLSRIPCLWIQIWVNNCW